jgi:hypothetical protein
MAKRGRPRKWVGRDGYQLMLAVNSIRVELGQKLGRRCTIAHALKVLRTRAAKYPSLSKWKNYQPDALQARLREARKFWPPQIKRLAKLQAKLDELAADQRRCQDSYATPLLKFFGKADEN